MSEHDSDYDIMQEVVRLLQSLHPSPSFVTETLDDTALVIISTSLIDKFLRVSLISGFHKSVVSKRRLAAVFEGQGPLSTFSAKISLCNMLGLTTPDVQHDLTILRKIRNEFAHSERRLSIANFPQLLALKIYSTNDIKDAVEERQKLKQSCVGIVGSLSLATLIRLAQYRFVTKHPDKVREECKAMLKEAGVDDPPPFL